MVLSDPVLAVVALVSEEVAMLVYCRLIPGRVLRSRLLFGGFVVRVALATTGLILGCAEEKGKFLFFVCAPLSVGVVLCCGEYCEDQISLVNGKKRVRLFDEAMVEKEKLLLLGTVEKEGTKEGGKNGAQRNGMGDAEHHL
jgi:hypothetical protein